MRVDLLNCAAINPPVLPPLGAVVMLCHTDAGLVLVDSGFGRADNADPARRIGPARFLLRPDLDDRHTAAHQIEAAGHDPEDVTHIVMTHLDLDHVGGIADFPAAAIHTTADEYAAAVTDRDWHDKRRYRRVQMSHRPLFRTHEGRGDVWDHELTGHEVVPGITLIPMPGHSRGHAAVAVEADGRGTLFHAGDAAFDPASFTATTPSGTKLAARPALRAFEAAVGRDHRAIRRNHRTLARLSDDPDVTVVPAHDLRIFDDLQAGA